MRPLFLLLKLLWICICELFVDRRACPLSLPNGPSAALESTPPQGGLGAQPPSAGNPAGGSPLIVDRGLYHSADALKEFVDLGDAPSYPVCGSIMTRNGSLLPVYELRLDVRLQLRNGSPAFASITCNPVTPSPAQAGLFYLGCALRASVPPW
jgi:hypothetical protein